ncbi:polyribonucleotide nucleotidyltransferase [Buchnera aphidicola (Ceratovacuna keduensis)]|uniref:polyribonucleotide nucleotidyltransferase n=1 Tax=Buchnera aphidicola TaxID=9 RepID=UPI0031B8B048
MQNHIKHKFKYGNNTVILETGIIAKQATSAVVANIDDTIVLVTVVFNKKVQEENIFFPLKVDYQERTYAAGRIPGGFFRREGRPSENEILTARLIDRPIRPLFPEGLLNEIQIVATVISVNPQINPDIVAIIGASAALNISGIPFFGPIGVARVGFINKKYYLNPTVQDMKFSNLDLIVSGTKNAILMVEAEANMLTEKEILNAILFGHNNQKKLIENIFLFSKKVVKPKIYCNVLSHKKKLFYKIKKLYKNKIISSYLIKSKLEREDKIDILKDEIVNFINLKYSKYNKIEIENSINLVEKHIFRNIMLKKFNRIDNRNFDEIRKIYIKTGILPRVHGSSLFTRGQTQSLVSITLGTSRDAQNLDELLGDKIDNFLFHYNFPSYSVGEIGLSGSPKRREIGHGKLAKKSLIASMPNIKEFPYTIRIVSEITESNGSSSMASVCGASLALMDAGVPIKFAIAGIAMGLIKKCNKYIILSDISGEEDRFGDMDFKVAGSFVGITSLQMDMKIEGITIEIIELALKKAKLARLKILNIMSNHINVPKKEISIFAPRIHTIKIDPGKIKDVIGKGGSVIRMLTEETGTTIEIEDDGTVKISSTLKDQAKNAIRKIKKITSEIEVGKIYSGKITKIVEFGAFVSIGSGKEGLVHISQISNKRINKVSNFLNINQNVSVKVLEIDKNGRLRLSIKDAKFS